MLFSKNVSYFVQSFIAEIIGKQCVKTRYGCVIHNIMGIYCRHIILRVDILTFHFTDIRF